MSLPPVPKNWYWAKGTPAGGLHAWLESLRAKLVSIEDALSGIGTSGTTFISTATYMIVEAGDYIATRSTTLTMPSGAQVALSTGQFVVVVDIGGSLYVSKVGTLQDGGPAPTPKIQVTPTGPTWTDDTDNGGGTWSTPTQAGVTYDPASGAASPGQSVTVTATPTAGYEFPVGADSSWTHVFPAGTPAVTYLGGGGDQNDTATRSVTVPLSGNAPQQVAAFLNVPSPLNRPISATIGGVTAEIRAAGSTSNHSVAIITATVPATGSAVIQVTFKTALTDHIRIQAVAFRNVSTVPYFAETSPQEKLGTVPAAPPGTLVVVGANTSAPWQIDTTRPPAWVGADPLGNVVSRGLQSGADSAMVLGQFIADGQPRAVDGRAHRLEGTAPSNAGGHAWIAYSPLGS